MDHPGLTNSDGGGIVVGTSVDVGGLVTHLTQWLEERRQAAAASGYVVGLSGGIDSAVTAALCLRTGSATTCLIMPAHSNPQDEADAEAVAAALGVTPASVNLGPVYDAFMQSLSAVESGTDLAKANLKPRLRMAALYYIANSRNALVVGTGNRSELYFGYFTKYGDGGVDLLPLGNLVKHEVRSLARALDIPAQVIEKQPSAGLWSGQTDEGEMGVSYEELDRYILEGKATPDIAQLIERAHSRSEHKRGMPSVASVGN